VSMSRWKGIQQTLGSWYSMLASMKASKKRQSRWGWQVSGSATESANLVGHIANHDLHECVIVGDRL
jgi:hypothetical protein